MEPTTDTKRLSTSSHDSNLSATATAVNSPDRSQFPPSASRSDHGSSTTSLSSSDNGDDDDDDQNADGSVDKMDPLQGWPQLARLLAMNPDFGAFSRFRELNVKSLLYYQCQLTSLRAKLHKLEYEDERDAKEFAHYADILVESDSDQFKTMEEIRKVLKQYNKALLQYSQVCALPDPEPFNMRTLRKWLRNEKCANFKVKSLCEVENTWGNIHKDPDDEVGGLWKQFFQLLWGLVWARTPGAGDVDLAVTSPQTKVDGLTRWVAAELIPFRRSLTKNWRKKKPEGQDVELTTADPTPWVEPVKKEETLTSWSEKGPLRITSGISTIVACLLPVVAISVLSQLHGLRDLLICLAGFAVVFALGLIFLTQGTSSRTEIFAATAAFSAVMVVFISQPPAPVIMVPSGSPMPSVSPSPTLA